MSPDDRCNLWRLYCLVCSMPRLEIAPTGCSRHRGCVLRLGGWVRRPTLSVALSACSRLLPRDLHSHRVAQLAAGAAGRCESLHTVHLVCNGLGRVVRAVGIVEPDAERRLSVPASARRVARADCGGLFAIVRLPVRNGPFIHCPVNGLTPRPLVSWIAGRRV